VASYNKIKIEGGKELYKGKGEKESKGGGGY
jgi:hypothetical protein